MSTLLAVLRWLALLPGAILGMILSSFPLHWILMASVGTDPEGSATITMPIEDRNALEKAIQPLFGSFGFVIAGAFVAPVRRVETAVVLAMIIGLALPFAIDQFSDRMVAAGWLPATLRTFGCIGGVALTHWKVSGDRQESEFWRDLRKEPREAE